jgi:hypothetical protein
MTAGENTSDDARAAPKNAPDAAVAITCVDIAKEVMEVNVDK